MIFKNLVLQALGTIRFRFLQKSQKKFHACVPLRLTEHFCLWQVLVHHLSPALPEKKDQEASTYYDR
jgi:hypothetical protein